MELSSPFSHPENTWKQSWHSNFCICWFWYLGWYHYTIWVRGGLSNEQGCWVRLSWVSCSFTVKFWDDWVVILLSVSISKLLGKMLCRATAEQYSKLQKKRARNSVPKCPCKLLQPADRPMAGSSSLEGHFGIGLRARFSSAWSNVECGLTHQY